MMSDDFLGDEETTRRPARLENVKIKDLNVDAYTQRSYSDQFARHLASNWTDAKAGVFKVSLRRDGSMYVIDGQHRRGALLHRDQGDSEVPALVYEGLTLRDEAEMFIADNNENRKPNALDVHRLLVVAGEEEATVIQRVLDDHGLSLSFGGNARSISAIGSLRWLYRVGGENLLDATLRVIENAWGSESRDSRDGALLKAVGHVIHEIPRLDITVLADKLAKNGKPGALLGDARTYRSVTKRSLWLESAHAVVAVYNKNRTSGRVAL